jgi:hypothetical protein
MITPGAAYWNQRFALHDSAERMHALSGAVDHPTDFTLFQFAQLTALALEFKPDLILELGRGFGNSTCAFTEAANRLPAPCRVVSLCDCASWQDSTLPRLRAVVNDDWFRPLRALQADIVQFDFEPILDPSKRILIFWDAHSFDIAECVLGRILRRIATKEHVVAMHDMADLRYCSPPEGPDYALWKGSDAGQGRFHIASIYSQVPQAISVLDFAWRNRLTLESADHSIHTVIGSDPVRLEEMRKVLGGLFSLNAFWYWFSLNEHPGPYCFPALVQRT